MQTDKHYVIINNKYQPINTAVTGIKCLICDSFYPHDRISSHLSTHIEPSYLKSISTKKPNFKKLKLTGIQTEPDIQSDIRVNQPFQENMPERDQLLRKVIRPHYSRPLSQIHEPNALLRSYEMLNNYITQPDSNKDAYSKIGNFSQIRQDTEQQLPLQKNIRLKTSQSTVKLNKINFYNNDNFDRMKIDRHIDRHRSAKDLRNFGLVSDVLKKSKGDKDGDVDDFYKIRKAKPQERISQQQVPDHYYNKSRYNFHTKQKKLNKTKKIHTISKYKPEQESFSQPQSSYIIRTPKDTDHDLMCPCCKGFYCSVCKSDIPPLYRPVPDENGHYHFHPDLQSVQFYRQHAYKNSAQICKNCDGRVYDRDRSDRMITPLQEKTLQQTKQNTIYHSNVNEFKTY